MRLTHLPVHFLSQDFMYHRPVVAAIYDCEYWAPSMVDRLGSSFLTEWERVSCPFSILDIDLRVSPNARIASYREVASTNRCSRGSLSVRRDASITNSRLRQLKRDGVSYRLKRALLKMAATSSSSASSSLSFELSNHDFRGQTESVGRRSKDAKCKQAEQSIPCVDD